MSSVVRVVRVVQLVFSSFSFSFSFSLVPL